MYLYTHSPIVYEMSSSTAIVATACAWLSFAFCVSSCVIVAHVTVTSYTRLRCILFLISLVQLVVTISNILWSINSIHNMVHSVISISGGIIFADVLIGLLLHIASPFYFTHSHRNIWYWVSVAGAVSASLIMVVALGLFIANIVAGDILIYVAYGIFIVSVMTAIWYTLLPLLRTKRERYGDSEPFAVGIW